MADQVTITRYGYRGGGQGGDPRNSRGQLLNRMGYPLRQGEISLTRDQAPNYEHGQNISVRLRDGTTISGRFTDTTNERVPSTGRLLRNIVDIYDPEGRFKNIDGQRATLIDQPSTPFSWEPKSWNQQQIAEMRGFYHPTASNLSEPSSSLTYPSDGLSYPSPSGLTEPSSGLTYPSQGLSYPSSNLYYPPPTNYDSSNISYPAPSNLPYPSSNLSYPAPSNLAYPSPNDYGSDPSSLSYPGPSDLSYSDSGSMSTGGRDIYDFGSPPVDSEFSLGDDLNASAADLGFGTRPSIDNADDNDTGQSEPQSRLPDRIGNEDAMGGGNSPIGLAPNQFAVPSKGYGSFTTPQGHYYQTTNGQITRRDNASIHDSLPVTGTEYSGSNYSGDVGGIRDREAGATFYQDKSKPFQTPRYVDEAGVYHKDAAFVPDKNADMTQRNLQGGTYASMLAYSLAHPSNGSTPAPESMQTSQQSTTALSNPPAITNVAQLQDLVSQGDHVPIWVSNNVAGDFLRNYGSDNMAILHPGVQMPGMVGGTIGPQTTGPGNLPQVNPLGLGRGR